MMRVALYARVSTDAQEARGTIGSQVEALRRRATAEGHEVVAECLDDGRSGAVLDRPGLDSLRDGAQAGRFEIVWCLSPDRLARSYAYQMLILDEMARYDVKVCFADAPPISDDPQARLLTQVQGVIAEYERAKIAERYRRGKLYRSRLGEVIQWKPPYGYRRLPRGPEGPARLEVFEPEAALVRRLFEDVVHRGLSVRQVVLGLHDEGLPSPTGKKFWGSSSVWRILHNEAYVGRTYFNRTQMVSTRPGSRRATRQVLRPRADWIAISVPPLVPQEVFDAVQRVSHDNSRWSPRRAEPGAWMLRGLVRCGACDAATRCHTAQGRKGTWTRYYSCLLHDVLRARGEDRRCTEHYIRADALDAFVLEQVRAALSQPQTLLTAERAVTAREACVDTTIVAGQLDRLERRVEAARTERRRIADLYQAGLLEPSDLERRARESDARIRQLAAERDSMATRGAKLVESGKLGERLGTFASRALTGWDALDHAQRQRLLRTVLESVRVQGLRVALHFRIPLDDASNESPTPRKEPPSPCPSPVSSDMRLRSLGGDGRRFRSRRDAGGPERDEGESKGRRP